ncbi:MAG: N-acetyl-gamma-glutamyl-phosphate reductase [Solirubrobacteraceae bacterium]|nr:N-acetyl-gamma-glutamyl-phosphate reductase [Solirubrobacteraceae bacterium]
MAESGDGPKVLIAGASGFAGAIAARLVQEHPVFRLGPITARAEAGQRLVDLYPQHRVGAVLEELDLDAHAEQADAAIVGYPHAAAAPVVKALLDRGLKVIDLSADFRLRDLATYEDWYGEHPHPELIGQSVYGLPELYREQLAGAQLVSGPGCFPTAALLGLRPLAAGGLLADVVIDAKTGVSGAGRGLSHATSYVTITDSVSAYKTTGHRHRPEIEQELAVSGSDVKVTFVPHLVPVDQGEYVTCYATLSARVSADEIAARYAKAYADEPFVEVVSGPPNTRGVRETNFCRIHVQVEEHTGRVMVFSAIDNLWKGTASQALQSLNVMYGLPETAGLLPGAAGSVGVTA